MKTMLLTKPNPQIDKEGLKVAFFDKENEISLVNADNIETGKKKVVSLYIYIEADNRNILIRKAGKRKKIAKDNEVSYIDETAYFSQAFNRYKQEKEALTIAEEENKARDEELSKLREEVKKLKNKDK